MQGDQASSNLPASPPCSLPSLAPDKKAPLSTSIHEPGSVDREVSQQQRAPQRIACCTLFMRSATNACPPLKGGG